MHAILIAKDEGLARALVLALAGMDIRISIFGEVEALRKSVHCDGFFHLPIDGSDESANRFAALANEIVDRQADTVIIPADVPSCLTMLAARSKLRCAFFPRLNRACWKKSTTNGRFTVSATSTMFRRQKPSLSEARHSVPIHS